MKRGGKERGEGWGEEREGKGRGEDRKEMEASVKDLE